MTRSFAVIAMVALLTGCDREEADDFTDADSIAVRALFDSVVADISSSNWDAWASRFAEDGILYPAHAKAVVGRPAIVAFGKGFPPLESFVFDNVQVWGEGNLAYGTSAVLIKVKDAPPDTSKQLVVMKRQGENQWLVAAVAVNSDLPLPTAPLPPSARR
jgi:ketosteroid isomerase-like protein